MIKNKKADIGVTILVFAILVLFASALFTFNYFSNKSAETTMKSSFYLESVYNLEDSLEYSKNYGQDVVDKYNLYKNLVITPKKDGDEIKSFKIAGSFFEDDLKITYEP
jgi:hypothetical protein